MSRRRVEVAAAVLLDGAGRFLLAQRPSGKVYAGYWEFPGGKVEPGERAADALVRELHEELGIEVTCASPWLTRDFEYEHADVRLRFFRVTAWRGELHGREQQAFAWQRIGAPEVGPILPANDPILAALALPAVYAVTHSTALGMPTFLERLDGALARGLRLVQVRDKELANDARGALAREVVRRAQAHGARVLINGDAALARTVGADGVHLTASQLAAAPVRPDLPLVAASCHEPAELERAVRLGLDFVVLGPVLPTASHPGSPTLGWARFQTLIENCPLPVYAIGGMRSELLDTAQRAGAHGIASMRDVWSAGSARREAGGGG